MVRSDYAVGEHSSMRELSSISDLSSVVTSEGLLVLLDITNIGTPLYYVNNKEAVTSNGQVYTPYAFNLVFAVEDGDSLPSFKLAVDAVDRELIDEIRTLIEAPIVKIAIVPISDPDTVEILIPDLELRNVSYTALSIQGTLTWGDPLNRRFPSERYTPETSPGLF